MYIEKCVYIHICLRIYQSLHAIMNTSCTVYTHIIYIIVWTYTPICNQRVSFASGGKTHLNDKTKATIEIHGGDQLFCPFLPVRLQHVSNF